MCLVNVSLCGIAGRDEGAPRDFTGGDLESGNGTIWTPWIFVGTILCVGGCGKLDALGNEMAVGRNGWGRKYRGAKFETQYIMSLKGKKIKSVS